MLTLLRDTKLDPEQNEQVKIATSSSKSLLTLINDILDFSKLEAGKLNYEHIEFDLETLVEECAEALSESAFRKDLVFLCQIDPDIPASTVGDPTRLRQVLTNLTSNAIKFTESGVVKILVQRCRQGHAEDQIKFTVSDTGIGISESALSSLFKSFAQADTSTTRKFGGTGLGLAISRRIIEGMNGQIGVNSVEDQGSTFWFTLNLPAASEQSVLARNNLALDAKTKVLLVEHIEQAKTNLSGLLHEQVTQLDHAENATEALHKISEATRNNASYDAVFFTTLLNDMTARQFCQKLAEQDKLERSKLIAINTINQARSNLYTHTNCRVVAHITKPAKRSDIAKALEIALSNASNTFSELANDEVDTPIDSVTHESEFSESVNSSFADQARSIAPNKNTSYQGITILVADDNLINQQVAQGMLEKLGFQSLLADNGQDALDVLSREKVDLVLMDCQMPVLDGFEATQQIRKRESNSHIPIIALTANVSDSDAQKCFASGMDDFLTKPIDINLFEETLVKALGDRIHDSRDSDTERKAA